MSVNAVCHHSDLFVGIMSGTSADGIDVAIVRCHPDSNQTNIEQTDGEQTDGEKTNNKQTKLIQFSEFPIAKTLRQSILRLATPGKNKIDLMGETDRVLGQAYAEAVLSTLQQAGLQATQIAAIGCHGQTIRHRPEAKHPFTLQIGCAASLAEQTGITVVSDFRSRDIAAGGEGAPLVPFAHQQLFASNTQNTAIVNIGGIANVTWLGADGYNTGFDIGPGNMLMDGLMLALSNGNQAFDQNGELAASGQPCAALLEYLMAHPFLARKPPKSTGRETFGDDIIQKIIAWPDISNADRLATACHCTANTIANSTQFMTQKPDQWFVCGGGARNTFLMHLLTEKLAPAKLQTTDAAAIPTQAVEAMSFALLARHTLIGSPNTLSQVTGASHDVCGGHITPGNNWIKLLQSIPTWIR